MTQKAGLEAREKYSTESNIEHAVHDLEGLFDSQDAVDGGDKFDLIILRVSRVTPVTKNVVVNAQKVLADKGYLIVVQDSSLTSESSIFVLFAFLISY